MAEYTRRVQILLSDEQFDFLQDLSERRQRSVGELIRLAVEATYRPGDSLRELRALDRLLGRVYLAGAARGADEAGV